MADLAEHPIDQSRFAMEFTQAAADLIKPRLDAINTTKKRSNTLQNILSGILGLGGVAVEAQITPGIPIGAIIGLLASQSSWLLYRFIQRFSKNKQTASLVRDFYAYLVPQPR